MNDLLNVSASPHVRSKDTTKTIMRDVAIAMIPTSIFGIYNFGVNALLLILTCVATCVLSEYIYERGMHRIITTSDYSAVVTGIILALNLPASAPLWMAILGSVFAIIIVKHRTEIRAIIIDTEIFLLLKINAFFNICKTSFFILAHHIKYLFT